MTAPDAQPPAATGAVDGLADWMRSVSWTSGPEANRIPEDLIDDVAALLHRKITAVAAALLARPGVSAALAGTTTPTEQRLVDQWSDNEAVLVVLVREALEEADTCDVDAEDDLMTHFARAAVAALLASTPTTEETDR